MHRARALAKADVAYQDAEELEHSPPESLSRQASLRRAARRYTSAADAYQRAGLGLMARRAYGEAARCWQEIGEANLCETSRTWQSAIPVYWSEEA
jgi:hypothetical protein